MHRYRELEELVKAVDHLPTPEPIDWGWAVLDEARQEKLDGLITLVESVELLICLIMTDNHELLEAGYPEHFFKVK